MTSVSPISKGDPMYRLRDLKNGMFQIHVKDGPAFEGTWFAIFTIAQDLGVQGPELLIAKEEIETRNDDYAEFGIFGGFMYTGRNQRKQAA